MLRRPFSCEQLKILFNNIDNCKIAVVCYLALVTGMRISEVTSLKISDIDLELKRIYKEKTKGDKPRTYILSDKTISILTKWISLLGNTDYVFPCNNGTNMPVSKVGFYNEYIKYLQKSGLWIVDKNKSNSKKQHRYNFHNLRTTFCSILVNSGTPVFVAKELMGHSKVSTTERHYIELGDKTLKNEIDRVFGGNKLAKKIEQDKSQEFAETFLSTPIETKPKLRDPLHELKIKLVNGEISVEEFKIKFQLLKEI